MLFQLVYCWDIWLDELVLCFLLKLESLGPVCQEGGLSSVEEMDLFYIVFKFWSYFLWELHLTLSKKRFFVMNSLNMDSLNPSLLHLSDSAKRDKSAWISI